MWDLMLVICIITVPSAVRFFVLCSLPSTFARTRVTHVGGRALSRSLSLSLSRSCLRYRLRQLPTTIADKWRLDNIAENVPEIHYTFQSETQSTFLFPRWEKKGKEWGAVLGREAYNFAPSWLADQHYENAKMLPGPAFMEKIRKAGPPFVYGSIPLTQYVIPTDVYVALLSLWLKQ